MSAEKIGKLIQKKRLEKKMTQEELASKLFVTGKAVSKWETGRGAPNIDMLMPLCKELDIELKELISGKENISYEEVLIKELKKNKKANYIKLIGGIILCLMLCLLEVVLYMANVSNKIGMLIFGIFIGGLLLVELVSYLIYKK